MLRAIIRNMHTWSSRLLKPKLQAAVAQALKLPCGTPAPKPRISGIGITSSGIFETPSGNQRAVSKTTPLIPTSAPRSGGNRSPHVSFTTPPSTGPQDITTSKVRETKRVNKKTGFPEISSPDDGMKEKGSNKSNSIAQLTREFDKCRLDSPASESNSPQHGPVKGNGALEHDPLDHQTPTRSSGVGKIKDRHLKAHSTSGSLDRTSRENKSFASHSRYEGYVDEHFSDTTQPYRNGDSDATYSPDPDSDWDSEDQIEPKPDFPEDIAKNGFDQEEGSEDEESEKEENKAREENRGQGV